MSIPSKPWPVAIFEEERPHLTEWSRKQIITRLENLKCRRIIVRAPVKCGKREIVEYVAMRDFVKNPTRVHAFISAWHRTADEEQRVELTEQNLTVFSIVGDKNADAFITWVDLQIASGKKVVIHLDECDHGSGDKQKLKKVWDRVRADANITIILYSATPEEVTFSGEADNEEYDPDMEIVDDMISEGHSISYTPPEGYCGAKRFLEEDLVYNAVPFFSKTSEGFALSQQGSDIIRDLRTGMRSNPSRNIIVLRLSYSGGGKKTEIKKNKAIYQFLSNLSSFPELSDCLIVADKGDDIGIRNKQIITEKVQWSVLNYWRRQTSGVPILIVIDQTSSRSTEWACHNRIFATHDYRNDVQYNTTLQAQQRSNHYEQKYPTIEKPKGEFQRIRIYGHKKSFELSAGVITTRCYLNHEWEKKKIDVRTSSTPLFRVRKVDGHQLHMSCPEGGISEEAADFLLQQLGCSGKISLSARVIGSVNQKNTFEVSWQPVNSENMSSFHKKAEEHRMPDGTWKGYYRGWNVIDYKMMQGDHGWGFKLGAIGNRRCTICYKDGVLGVATVRCTGVQEKNTLRPEKSMYIGK